MTTARHELRSRFIALCFAILLLALGRGFGQTAIPDTPAVGETTGGGAHPVQGRRIDDHFMIGVPFARAINPISKTNWEGTGVTPDVSAKASEALEVAEKLATQKVEKK